MFRQRAISSRTFLFALLTSTLVYVVGCRGAGSRHAVEWTAEDIVVGLWTPDKEVESDALTWAARVRDPRILEALVGKLKAECAELDPEYPYAMSVVTALEYQGVKVQTTTNEYRIKYPGWKYWLRVPLKMGLTEVVK